jgi:diadenosine tetraphosphate (Ap4A) HIT family hydrolase
MYSDYLWSPGRMKWVKNAKPYKGCVFCGIAKNDPRVPKKVIYKDKLMMVIMNIFPYNVGHLQVVPLRHVEWPEQLTEEEYAHFFDLVKKTMILLKKALNPVGFNAGMNLGVSSGQSINHLHFQIVPRYKKEIGFMESLMGVKVMPETLDATYRKIMKHADLLKE